MAKKQAGNHSATGGADRRLRVHESMQRLADGVWPGAVLVVHGESDTFNGYLMLVSDAADEDEMDVTLAHVPAKVRHEVMAEIAEGQRRGIVETQEWQYHWALLQGGGPAAARDLTARTRGKRLAKPAPRPAGAE